MVFSYYDFLTFSKFNSKSIANNHINNDLWK